MAHGVEMVDALERKRLGELRDFLILERMDHGRSTLAHRILTNAIVEIERHLAGQELSELREEQKLKRWLEATK